MTCSDFILKYCEIYKLQLRPIEEDYIKGTEMHSLKFLIFILRRRYGLSFRHIGKLLYRSHQDIAFHYNSMLTIDFYQEQAAVRYMNVGAIHEI